MNPKSQENHHQNRGFLQIPLLHIGENGMKFINVRILHREPIKRAMVVDVETTGLSTENDDVIQLAMLPFDYEVESGRILTVHKALAFEGLREPAVPISEEVSLITGITNDMVQASRLFISTPPLLTMPN